MPEVTVRMGGEDVTYPTKKEMLKGVGRAILSGSDGPMTLRQLYYRFVAKDLIPNKESQYSYLGEAIKEARIEGRIPWSWIEDRTRSAGAGDHRDRTPREHFESNLEYFKNTARRYHRPRWQGQDTYVEVWVEKEALAGVFETVCNDLKVVSFPNRGYTSVTLLKEAADRFSGAMDGTDELPVILYFGDFDPSGQDIERNIREKIQTTFGVPVLVERVALTRDQIEERRLPPQPAKRTDSRYEDFVAEHGDMAVELDALEPSELRGMIRDAVGGYFDDDHYEEEVLPEQREGREWIRGRVEGVLDDDA